MMKVTNLDFSSIYDLLTDVAHRDSFWSLFDTAFGSHYDAIAAKRLRSQWLDSNFNDLPQIEVVSSQILGSANGVYASSTNRVYLSDQFVSVASHQSLEAVILEEIGHYVDAQVNTKDTPGDEGELFSYLMQGVKLSSSELTRIQTEDDHAVVMIGGQPIAIEMAFGATGFIQFGTSKHDEANGISTDNNGNVYVTGYTYGSLPGNSNLGDYDAFVAKYDSSGTQVWVKQLGTSKHDYAYGISTDSSGHVYITGSTDGSLPGNRNLSSYSSDAYVAKYDASGTQVWVKQFGTFRPDLGIPGSDSAYGINTDSSGNVYVTGSTYGASFPGNSELGGDDAYVAKYDASGTQVWVEQFGTPSRDYANGISTDSSGNVYVAGYTNGSLPGNSNLGYSNDAYVAKYDSSGNQLWVKQFGTSSDDSADGISTDNSGNIYVTGTTLGRLPGNSSAGYQDTFVAKYDASGNQLWVKQFGSYDYDYAKGISTDSSGNVYVTGFTPGNLPGNSNLGNGNGSSDAFVVKYDANGNRLWVKQFGTSYHDHGNGISTDSNGNAYVAGYTYLSLPGNNNVGDVDAFIAGFDANGNLLNTSNPLPLITLAVSPNSATEDGTNSLFYTFTRTGYTTNSLTVNYGISGTADSSDYTGATPGTGKTITFAAGSATATLTIDPTADVEIEPYETVALTLAVGSSYTIGTAAAVVGTILNDDTAIENQGNTALLRGGDGQSYVSLGISTSPITYLGSPTSPGNTSSTWQMLAAETIGGSNKLLWRYNPTGQVHVWALNSNWGWTGSDTGLVDANSSTGWGLESSFQLDLNGDSLIGAPYTTIESQGNTSLVRNTSAQAYVNVGNTTTPITYLGTPTSPGNTSSTWQMLAAETIGGSNKLLWRYNPTGQVHVWALNSSWGWTGSDTGLVDANSSAGFNLLAQFGVASI